VIRVVDAHEYEAVGTLVESAYAASGLLDNDRGYGNHLRDVPGRAADHLVLVAERQGHLVGSVTITPYGSPQSELARPDEVEFRYLGVAREARGTGVAQALVGAVEDYAVATRASWLVLCVIADNAAAQRLYARLGFERVPERDWHPAPGIDLCFSRRRVPAASAGP
jgi:ribosomal protein S18 acetylase RimI-like enzyme